MRSADDGTHHKFILSVDGAGEQQAGDVDAGNQQQNCNSAEQQIERFCEVRSKHQVKGHDAHAKIVGEDTGYSSRDVAENGL